jgi:hypothetical protein
LSAVKNWSSYTFHFCDFAPNNFSFRQISSSGYPKWGRATFLFPIHHDDERHKKNPIPHYSALSSHLTFGERASGQHKDFGSCSIHRRDDPEQIRWLIPLGESVVNACRIVEDRNKLHVNSSILVVPIESRFVPSFSRGLIASVFVTWNDIFVECATAMSRNRFVLQHVRSTISALLYCAFFSAAHENRITIFFPAHVAIGDGTYTHKTLAQLTR